ncbi:hypothetical protein Tco_1424209 [Tanacetum coccineum]
MGCGEEIEEMLEIKVIEMGGDEEMFTSEAWRRTFDINEPIFIELCHEFYSTFEFNKDVPKEELWSTRLIKFRLARKDHSLTLVQFSKHLGLYENEDVISEGFESYFIGGLHSDDNFNAMEYWLRISSDDDLQLSRSHAAKIKKPETNIQEKDKK